MDIIIRKAKSDEGTAIAQVIARSFEKDFGMFAKSLDQVAKLFESGVNAERFLVAEQGGKLIGILGCGDRNVRSLAPSKKSVRQTLGLVRGFLVNMIMAEEFLKPFDYPETTGWVEIVGVLEEARGKGVVKALLSEMISHFPQYDEFILNTQDTNHAALGLYAKFGFGEFMRVPYKFAKHTDFESKVHMRYTKKEIA